MTVGMEASKVLCKVSDLWYVWTALPIPYRSTSPNK